ncbi:SusC/RagA family TonB-linked outer membrane protein [Roseivirga pacifica]|uniref:SusC/RagA family TonB-linked outer membrane protein n=1 Tax=Roseivirga pacifica TaxID=1267423 RepID=UPI002096310F|nr:SusC/RagA family TonB-linked outer membrane protein [Roseivirga pacifica]MCO6366976.1 SusC/RagA family TonB-linked outer membrane protein [Roseivirga pacifica]MCO6370492.1 SusC/RagA family TonB-linked outer membrane protein [Roseivirga pacifica]MCO6374633.1 SusC/RagA family TonB-linked outer membrane protein [Roseivirga pacifica]MCO6379891.1 SusC/RagA family TonB-linked outer membrane protein [Roseivirga pacifica]
MNRVLLTVVLSVLVVFAQAQERAVSGTVADETGLGLPGVNVLIKGTTQGVPTNADGTYRISVPGPDAVLIFRFLGYTTQEITVGSQSTINVEMQPDIADAGEVVVTALGITRDKRSLGYSVQEVSGDDVNRVKTDNIVSSLSGKIAGVQITNGSGPGSSSRVVIRGVNSISGNNQPLFVVDGTPIDNSNFNAGGNGGGGVDYGNAAADINPDDVESVTVLKGASAAALYGSRAANGVILITTKKGTKRKGIGVTYSTSVTFNDPLILPEYQNEYGGGYKQTFDTYEGEPVVNYAADESWGPRMDGQMVRQWYSWYPDDPDFGKLTPFVPHENNIRDFYETGVTTNNNVSLAGGNDASRYRLSMTNYTSTSVIPENKLAKNTISLNASTNLTEKFTASTNFSYINLKNDNIPGNGYGSGAGNVVTSFNQWFQRQLDMDKLKNYQTADGVDRTWNIKSPTDLDPLYWENPYYVLNNSTNDMARERVFGNISLRYQITPGLSVQGWARTDFYTDRREQSIASGSIPQDAYSESVRQFRENNYELLVQYQKVFDNELDLSINAGANSRQSKYNSNGASTVGGLNVPNFFNINASIDRPSITDYESNQEVNSVYGSASLGYKGTYFLEASLRNDWSSTLPADNNSFLYPSVTGSVVLSELINLDVLSFAKVRGSWSQVGNDTSPYQLQLTFDGQNNYGSFPAYSTPNTINNPNLKPETITSQEVGIEFSLLDSRVGADFTYYHVSATDQILPLDIASTTGYNSTIVNAGEMVNKGIEVSLRGTPVRSENGLTWDVNFNWARNRNEVIELAEGQTNYLIASWGPSINAKIGEPYGTFVTDGFVYNDNGDKVVTDDGYFERATNQTYGSYLPNWTGGFTNSFSYKGFNLSAHIDFQDGGTLYSVSNRYGTYSGMFQTTVGTNAKGNPIRDDVSAGGGVLADGVKSDGSPNDVYVDAQEYFKHLSSRREYYLYDASFIKLREVRLSYSLPQSMLSTLPLNGVDIALIGRNLAILHKNVPNVDPESAYGSGNTQGFENGQHPSTRSIGFNLTFRF